MQTTVKVALVALAVAGGPLVAVPPASADVTVAVGSGPAFGYSDGYWDRGHQWHQWRNQEEAAQFRSSNRDHYYNWKHDRDSNQGWRSNDQWWNHR